MRVFTHHFPFYIHFRCVEILNVNEFYSEVVFTINEKPENDLRPGRVLNLHSALISS